MLNVKSFALVTGLCSMSFLSACDWNQTSAVEKAQQNLNEVRAESAKNIQQAEAELAEVIAKTTAKLEAAKRDLPSSPTVETSSGTTQPATDETTTQ